MKFFIFLLALNACVLWCLLVVGLISRLLYWRQTRKSAPKQEKQKLDSECEYMDAGVAELCPVTIGRRIKN